MAKVGAENGLSFLMFFGLLFSSILMAGCISTTQSHSGNMSDIARGNNQFALDIFAQIRGSPQENVFFSSWSIYSALGIVREGARGMTAQEMQQVMHLPENDSMRKKSFAGAYDEFNARDAGYILSTANALWVEKNFPLLGNFTSDIEKYYHGAALGVDFEGEIEDTRNTINSWVEERTGGKIKDLISPGDISPQTRIIITNAVYFNGSWVRSFDRNATRKSNFMTGDGRIVETPMMESIGRDSRFNYTETADLQALELPYQGNRISMIILLPRDNDISTLEKGLSLDRLTELKSALKENEVDVYIPKFAFTTKYQMSNNLRKMGMASAFTPDADFSGIDGKKDLFISEVIHQAFVDVNEKGTEAAGSTGIAMPMGAMNAPRTPVFNADHPFLFLIQDTKTGTIMFMGRVSDPGNK